VVWHVLFALVNAGGLVLYFSLATAAARLPDLAETLEELPPHQPFMVFRVLAIGYGVLQGLLSSGGGYCI
jgi:hypothetical protein